MVKKSIFTPSNTIMPRNNFINTRIGSHTSNHTLSETLNYYVYTQQPRGHRSYHSSQEATEDSS
jgi:hypothetical protein